MQQCIGILAMDPHGIIGLNGNLPWHIPDDLEHFRSTTKDKIVIMGRKSYATFPKNLLKNRTAYVVSRTVTVPTVLEDNVTFIPVFESIYDCVDSTEELYMIGGAQLTEYCLDKNYIDTFILSILHDQYEGDVRIPIDKFSSWDKKLVRAHENFDIFVLRNPLSAHYSV